MDVKSARRCLDNVLRQMAKMAKMAKVLKMPKVLKAPRLGCRTKAAAESKSREAVRKPS